MRISSSTWGMFCSVLALGGCVGPDDADDLAASEGEIVSDNGRSLNGVSMNGTSLNGRSLNGRSLNGVSLSGATLSGTSLTGATLTGTLLAAKKGTNTVSGAGLVNSLWSGVMSDGEVIKLRIDNAAALAAPNGDVWAYGVSYQTSGGWLPLCGSATIKAVPIIGTFNYGVNVSGGGSYTYDTSKFTFGCRATAIAKCVELGYKPWKSAAFGTPLRNHHVACTRMLRADYCGDGRSFTVDGMSINLYDAVGVQVDTDAWRIDAEWTAAGARCVKQSTPPRLATTPPSCYTSKVRSTCGATTSFTTGTLLVNEVQ